MPSIQYTTLHAAGIDVSHNNGVVDWTKVKASGVEFSFIKATDGAHFVDPMLHSNLARAVDAGMICGLYHFFHPDVPGPHGGSATDQANHYNELTQYLVKGVLRLPPVLDFETGGVPTRSLETFPEGRRLIMDSSLADGALLWLLTVESLTKMVPIIYTSPGFFDGNVPDSLRPEFSKYPLWVSEWQVHQPQVPAPWDNWQFWQFTETGRAAGVAGNVDLDWFNGSAEDLTAWLRSIRP